jgi:hypothetical protein
MNADGIQELNQTDANAYMQDLVCGVWLQNINLSPRGVFLLSAPNYSQLCVYQHE